MITLRLSIRTFSFAITLATLVGCSDQQSNSLGQIESPAGKGSAQPHLSTTNSGDAVLSWLESTDTGVALKFSTLDDDQWSEAKQISQGDDWFVNWADFPSVTPITQNLWAAHWLVKRPGGDYSYDVAIALSEDAGKSWQKSFTPHKDGTPIEHGFVSLFPWQNAVGAIWLDGRHLAEHNHGHSSSDAAMTLRSARIENSENISQEHVIDAWVCDCCQTDVAITSRGPIAVYRNRTKAEIRDIYVSRFEEESWSEGIPVANDGWKIDGCPVNGPAVTAKDNVVGVAWFTAANNQPKVRFALSEDAAISFSPALDIDTQEVIGRVDIVMLSEDTMAISWIKRSEDAASTDESQGDVFVQKATKSAVIGSPIKVTTISTSRPSGFPQMVRVKEELVFAWTEFSEGESRVATSLIPISQLANK